MSDEETYTETGFVLSADPDPLPDDWREQLALLMEEKIATVERQELQKLLSED